MAPRTRRLAMLVLGIAGARGQQVLTPVTHWHLGNLGEDCRATCGQRGLTCDPSMNVGLDPQEMYSWVNSLTSEGYGCVLDGSTESDAQPGYLPSGGEVGLCLHGHIPEDSAQDRQCERSHPGMHRWCKCSSMIEWHLGNPGEDCYATCGNEGMVCDESVNDGFSPDSMQQVISAEQGYTCAPPLTGSQPGFRPGDENGVGAECLGDPLLIPTGGIECNVQETGVMRWCKCSSVSTCPVPTFWCSCNPLLDSEDCAFHEFEQIYLDCDGDNYLDPYCRRRPQPGETWIWPSDMLEGCVETANSCADTWQCEGCFSQSQN